MGEITYLLSFEQARSHYIDIQIVLTGFDAGPIELKMAVWTPGSYMIREYSKNLVSIDIFSSSAGSWQQVNKTSKNTFPLIISGNLVQVRYRIYAAELTVRTSYADQYHAYLNGAGIFLYPAGYQHLPCKVYVKPEKKWPQVYTSMVTIDQGMLPVVFDEAAVLLTSFAAGSSVWSFRAGNYKELVDSPISLGNFSELEFTALGIPHKLIAYNCAEAFTASVPGELIQIIETEFKIFGEHPAASYLFQVYGSASGRGGLEHADSCSLMIQHDKNGSFDRTEYLLLLAHEYFHLWNGKRLCPAELYSIDYESENYTRLLWVVEGFTSYYESQVLLRAGLITVEVYLSLLEKSINHYLNLPGRHIQSLADSSFDAWIKFYLPNENSANTTVSYYQKGSLIACMLDLKIIEETAGRESLDSVMRILYQQVYMHQKRGYTSRDVKAVLSQFIPVGIDAFFEQFIEGLAELDLSAMLKSAGLALRPAYPGDQVAYLGISVHKELHTILQVRAGSPAALAGLSAGDELITIDNEPFLSLAEQIGSKQPGQQIEIEFKRAFQLLSLPVVLIANPLAVFSIEELEFASSEQKAVYHAWLNGR